MKIQPYLFENDRLVRTINKKGEPWFVAKDVCHVLGITKYRDALARLDDDERGSVLLDTPGGEQEMATISESGLYALTFRSRKPEAKRFKKWVTSDVLPAIRRTGRYESKSQPEPSLDETVYELKIKQLQDEKLQMENDALRTEIIHLKNAMFHNRETFKFNALKRMRRINGITTEEIAAVLEKSPEWVGYMDTQSETEEVIHFQIPKRNFPE